MTEMINILHLKLISAVNAPQKGWGLARLFVARGLSHFFSAALYFIRDNRQSILKQRASVKRTLRGSSVPKPET